MERSVLLYDADCGFCRRWIHRWKLRFGDRVRMRPAGWLARARYGITREQARRSVQWIESNGRVRHGASAVFHALGHAPGFRVLSLLAQSPIVLPFAEIAYRLIARNRRTAARLDRWLTGRRPIPARHTRIRRLFFTALGFVYFAAFRSLRRQVLGLYGARGIVPMRPRIERLRRVLPRPLRSLPHFVLGDASDRALVAALKRAEWLSLALASGLAPRTIAALLWMHYYPFVAAGSPFLNFQWDALLLETGLHAILIAPPSASWRRRDEEPTAIEVALMRWLVFRLHFESGLVKFRSPDACWRERTALSHYFETAPLPTTPGWYVHHLPRRVHAFATTAALDIELFAPFLALGPRRIRQMGFALLTGLQTLIAATGNYGFFNLLTVALNLWLLDDAALPGRRETRIRPSPTLRSLAVDAAALSLTVFTVASFANAFARRRELPTWCSRALSYSAAWTSVNTYGPFSVMTTTRPEIVVEGSRDGQHWARYDFAHKIDDPTRSPRWVAPHQPRLDWQMWFAALDGVPDWFIRFASRLLEGSPDVRALLAHDPFPNAPPAFLRAIRFDYRATTLAEHAATGRWWAREPAGTYLPAVRLGPNPIGKSTGAERSPR